MRDGGRIRGGLKKVDEKKKKNQETLKRQRDFSLIYIRRYKGEKNEKTKKIERRGILPCYSAG